MDMEKVIKGLELCEIGSDNRCYETECPYYGQGCTESLKNDILALLKEQDETIKELQNAYGYLQNQFFEAQDKLLKEQEAVEPKIDAFGHPYCPKCKILVYQTWNFCPHCGQAVKWE